MIPVAYSAFHCALLDGVPDHYRRRLVGDGGAVVAAGDRRFLRTSLLLLLLHVHAGGQKHWRILCFCGPYLRFLYSSGIFKFFVIRITSPLCVLVTGTHIFRAPYITATSWRVCPHPPCGRRQMHTARDRNSSLMYALLRTTRRRGACKKVAQR